MPTTKPQMTNELRANVLKVVNSANPITDLLWCVRATGDGYSAEIYEKDAWRGDGYYILSGPYKTATAAQEAKKLFEMGFSCPDIEPLILDIYAEKGANNV